MRGRRFHRQTLQADKRKHDVPFKAISQKRGQLRGGYILMEIIIALALFATVAVSLVKALHMTSRASVQIQDKLRVDRILRSAMREALSDPNLEEGTKKITLAELTGDQNASDSGEIETIVEPLELENEDGQLLQKMYKIRVVYYWHTSDGWQELSAETWRYLNLYKP